MVIRFEEIMTIYILDPFLLAASSTYSSQPGRGDAKTAITSLLDISFSSFSHFFTALVNSATRLARTCPFYGYSREIFNVKRP